MATQYDIAFLRLLMDDGGTDKPTAMRCLQLVDQQAQQGRAVTAMEAAVRMGLIDEGRARDVDARTRATLQSGPPQVPIGQSGVIRPSQMAAIAAAPAPPPVAPPAMPAMPAMPSMPAAPVPLPETTPSPGTADGELVVERTMEFDAVMPLKPPEAPPTAPAPAPTVAAPAPSDGGDAWFDLAPHGTGLADYELGAKVGESAMAIRYRGRRKADQVEVVLQALTPKFKEHEALHQQILEDVQPWSALDHPQLARVEGIGESQGRTVVVYTRRGLTGLDQVLQAGPLDPGRALKAIYQVAQGLAAAHQAGTAHGDIRAATVVLEGEQASLIDGGLARASAIAAGFGQFGMAFGHPAYIAPEVIRDKLGKPTPTSDVYALGILAYQLLCGKLPFPLEGEVLGVIKAHYEATLPPPPPDVTFGAAIAALILRMVAKKPEERVPDAGMVVESIEALLAGKPLPLPPLPDGGAQPPGESTGEISSATWNEQVRRSTGVVETFDPSEIEAVGPAEWSPDDSDGDEPVFDKNMSLMSAIKSEELKEAAAEARKKREAAKGKKGKKGKGDEGNKKQLIISAAGIVGVLLVMVVLFALGGDEKKKPPVTPTTDAGKLNVEQAKQTGTPKPAIDPGELARAVSDYEDRARELISGGEFKKAFELDKDLPKLVRDAPAGQTALKKIHKEAEEGSRKKLEKVAKVVKRLTSERDYKGAKRRVKSAAKWAIDASAVQQLNDRIKDAREQELAPLKALKLDAKGKKRLPKARAALGKRLKGRWNLLAEGGFAIDFPRGAGLKADLTLLSKRRPDAFKEVANGVRVAAGKTPVLVALEVPFASLLDIAVELEVRKQPEPGARLALVVGVRRKNKGADWRGTGLDWGLAPVAIRDGGLGNAGAAPEMPTIQTATPLRLELKAHGRRGRYRLRGSLRQGRRGKPVVSARARTGVTAGFAAIYLEKVDVVLTGLSVRGLLDPAKVRGAK